LAGNADVPVFRIRKQEMTFHSSLERQDPPSVAGEREALLGWLDFHRATLLSKLEGLDDEQVRRPVAPSGLTLLGLVKHLTETEHGWFVNEYAQAGEAPLFETEDDEEAGFRVGPGESTEQIAQNYIDMCERCRTIVLEAPSLDDVVPNARHGQIDLRRIMIHMIEETARHNGHADLIRELIDGSVGD
jgi:uncharacterized damage-inducible protein DinB